MAQSQFSLSWDAHKKNICSGLSSLQQNGEFVDMTLAADGHFVKVHQIIMALASPYIKELISSAQCPHPIIFLNKISYTTLCAILEYIYTGEVLISLENLGELMQAARELHIKGLEDMDIPRPIALTRTRPGTDISNQSQEIVEQLDDEICYFQITNPKGSKEDLNSVITGDCQSLEDNVDVYEEDMHDDSEMAEVDKTYMDETKQVKQNEPSVSMMQYTVSNQGSLQMILNRFVYYLKHTNRNNSRQWRCVDYISSIKCPAHVVTQDDVVTQRVSAHTHPFHDKKILKKVRAGAVFSALHEAEQEGNNKKNQTTDHNTSE